MTVLCVREPSFIYSLPMCRRYFFRNIFFANVFLYESAYLLICGRGISAMFVKEVMITGL